MKAVLVGVFVCLLLLTGCTSQDFKEYTTECKIHFEDDKSYADSHNDDYILCCKQDGNWNFGLDCERIENNYTSPMVAMMGDWE